MPHSKRGKTEQEKKKQFSRTKENKIKKYQRLISRFPDSPDRKKWEVKLAKTKEAHK